MSTAVRVAARWSEPISALLHFASYGEHPKRSALISAFFRLRWAAWMAALRKKPLRNFSLLGRTMYFSDHVAFSFLLMELFIQETYKGCASTPENVLDLGSNIGMSILFFKSLWPNCRILGVEAAPEVYGLLEKNVKGLAEVTVVNRAVSDSYGAITIYSTRGSTMGSTNAVRGGSEGVAVEAIPLSSLITGPLDLLKIDIEGSEVAAFAELERSGKMRLIKQMFIEYHHQLPGATDSFAAFLERLERSGFSYELAGALPGRPGEMQDVLIRARRIDTGES